MAKRKQFEVVLKRNSIFPQEKRMFSVVLGQVHEFVYDRKFPVIRKRFESKAKKVRKVIRKLYGLAASKNRKSESQLENSLFRQDMDQLRQKKQYFGTNKGESNSSLLNISQQLVDNIRSGKKHSGLPKLTENMSSYTSELSKLANTMQNILEIDDKMLLPTHKGTIKGIFSSSPIFKKLLEKMWEKESGTTEPLPTISKLELQQMIKHYENSLKRLETQLSLVLSSLALLKSRKDSLKGSVYTKERQRLERKIQKNLHLITAFYEAQEKIETALSHSKILLSLENTRKDTLLHSYTALKLGY